MKLYHSIPNVSLPSMVIENQSPVIVRYESYHQLVMITWPNGKPCILANEWLRSESKRRGPDNTTDTCLTYGAHLSFLIRYCYAKQIDIGALTDRDIFLFVENLQDGRMIIRGIDTKKRSNNQIGTILNTCFRFLTWVQEEFRLASEPKLIGLSEHSPQITIKRVYNYRTKKYDIVHAFSPPRVAPVSDKIAMPDEYIEKLENQIFHRTYVRAPRYRKRVLNANPNSGGLPASLDYLYERRIFCIWMFQRTGLRPEELCRMDGTIHRDDKGQAYILLPTMKTRSLTPPLRKFPFKLDDELRLEQYLESRTDYLNIIYQRSGLDISSLPLLINEQGAPLKKESLTKEFSRLAKDAGLDNVKVCLSMFRHRFITLEILYELKSITPDGSPPSGIWLSATRDSICKKVASKTGHRQPSSLYTYFDTAYKFSTLFSNSDDAEKHLREIEAKKFKLMYERHRLMKLQLQGSADEAVLQHAMEWVDKFDSELRTLQSQLIHSTGLAKI